MVVDVVDTRWSGPGSSGRAPRRRGGARVRHAGRAARRLPGPLRVAAREVPRPRPQSHHRRGQRRLPPGDADEAAGARGPPALRCLPRQPRRSGHRRHAQSQGVPHPRPARTHPRHHVGAEIRHPAPRSGGGRLRGALLECLQLARSGARRLRDIHRARGRRRHGVHPAQARGILPFRFRPARRDGGRGRAAGPRGGGSRPGPQGGERRPGHPLRAPPGTRPAEDELLRQRQPRAPDAADADPRTRRAGPGRAPGRRSTPPRARRDSAERAGCSSGT